MSIANNHPIEELILVAPIATGNARPPRVHLPPSIVIPLHQSHLRPEPDQPVEVELPCKILEVAENLAVSGEPPVIAAGAGAAGWEGVVEEAHALAGEVGPERIVEAAVDDLAKRVEAQGVGLGGGCVDPGASDGSAALEDDDAMALAAELTRGREAGRAGPDYGHVTGGRRRGNGTGSERGGRHVGDAMGWKRWIRRRWKCRWRSRSRDIASSRLNESEEPFRTT